MAAPLDGEQPVRQLLEKLRPGWASLYGQLLEQNGFETCALLQHATREDLRECGLKIGHAAAIVAARGRSVELEDQRGIQGRARSVELEGRQGRGTPSPPGAINPLQSPSMHAGGGPAGFSRVPGSCDYASERHHSAQHPSNCSPESPFSRAGGPLGGGLQQRFGSQRIMPVGSRHPSQVSDGNPVSMGGEPLPHDWKPSFGRRGTNPRSQMGHPAPHHNLPMPRVMKPHAALSRDQHAHKPLAW